MYGSKIRYLASVFVDAGSITASVRNITKLADALGDEKLLPIIGMEPSSDGVSPRIGFHTENGEWRLLLVHDRLDWAHLPTDPDGTNLGDFATFCRNAVPKLTATLHCFERKAHRLAAVQEGLLPEMPSSVMEDIARRLFYYPSIFSKYPPFEWDWRLASHIDRLICELIEPTNTLATIKRFSGSLLSGKNDERFRTQTFDKIRVDFDINTIPDNIVGRFEDRHIQDFFEKVHLWHGDFSSEIFSFILGK